MIMIKLRICYLIIILRGFKNTALLYRKVMCRAVFLCTDKDTTFVGIWCIMITDNYSEHFLDIIMIPNVYWI